MTPTTTTTVFQIEADFCYHRESQDPDLAGFLDLVYEHLTVALDCPPVSLVSEGDRSFTVLMTVEASDGQLPEEIMGGGLSTLRAAFHAVGAATPGWPVLKISEPRSVQVTELAAA